MCGLLNAGSGLESPGNGTTERSTGLSWARLDDKFPRHRRVRQLQKDTAAKWLHVCALCFCCEQLTDGLVDNLDLEQIIADSEIPKATAKRCVSRLETVGLWVRHDARNAWIIRDFLDYNPTKDEVKARREAKSAAGRLGGLNSGRSRTRSKNEANA